MARVPPDRSPGSPAVSVLVTIGRAIEAIMAE
jgi:hypothetical protein